MKAIQIKLNQNGDALKEACLFIIGPFNGIEVSNKIQLMFRLKLEKINYLCNIYITIILRGDKDTWLIKLK